MPIRLNRAQALNVAINDHVEAIRMETHAMRESTLVHPANPAAAIAIEAHLDAIVAAAREAIQ